MINNERIQKVISNFGKYSRRQVEELIKDRRVKINGKIAILGDRVSSSDSIAIDGKIQNLNLKHKYFILNKPIGYICTREDEFGKETISLIPNENNRNLFTIGRLDVNTTGLIIVTTDGKLNELISSPENKIKKVYLAWLNFPITKSEIISLSKGIILNNGYITRPAKISLIKTTENSSCIKISIFEGKNNQIKRMIESLGIGKKVENLKRIQIGNIKLDNLETGNYKIMTRKNIYDLLNLPI